MSMVSGGSGTAEGNAALADAVAPRRTLVTGLAALAAVLVLVSLIFDAMSRQKFGWDAGVNCAAADAHIKGLDAYFVKNLKGTELPYPYLPVMLDVFRPLCAGGILVGHYRSIFLALAILCGLLLPGLDPASRGPREAFLRVILALGGFLGFEWVWASGNFAMFSAVLTVVALAILLRPSPPTGEDRVMFLLRFAGAALLGLITSFKLVFCPVLAALYFLPLTRSRKLMLILVAVGMLVLPLLLSRLLYADLFQSWLSAISGKIPDQYQFMDDWNPSLLLLATTLADRVGLANNKPIVFAVYGLIAVALILAPFTLSVLRTLRDRGPLGWGSFVKTLDRWLMEHPREATRITVLAMYAAYLCAPRLKEYAFFELALYAAVLVVDLPSTALAAILTIAVVIPTTASILGNAAIESFGQLAAGVACFWILLLDFRARPASVAAAAEIAR